MLVILSIRFLIPFEFDSLAFVTTIAQKHRGKDRRDHEEGLHEHRVRHRVETGLDIRHDFGRKAEPIHPESSPILQDGDVDTGREECCEFHHAVRTSQGRSTE